MISGHETVQNVSHTSPWREYHLPSTEYNVKVTVLFPAELKPPASPKALSAFTLPKQTVNTDGTSNPGLVHLDMASSASRSRESHKAKLRDAVSAPVGERPQ
jgi:hypothetical protein